jgi:TATA-binding protein-associated factor
MRHTITTVRLAAITTLERLLSTNEGVGSPGGAAPHWVSTVIADAMRLTFQNLLLESNEAVVASSRRVWGLLVHSGGLEKSAPFLAGWFALAATPAGMRLDTNLLFSGGKLQEKDRGGPSKKGGSVERSGPLVGAEGSPSAVEMRSRGGWALARLAAALPAENVDTFCGHVMQLLKSPRSTSRQLAGIIMSEWFKGLGVLEGVKTEVKDGIKSEGGLVKGEVKSEGRIEGAEVLKLPAVAALKQDALELLQANDPGLPTPGSAAPYSDLKPVYTRMREEAAAMVRHARAAGVKTPALRLDALTLDQVAALASGMPDVTADVAGTPDKQGATPAERLMLSKQKVLLTIGALREMQAALHRSARGSLAGAVVFSGELPPKLNNLIQPLMASVRYEREESLQLPASRAIAELVLLCRGRTPGPNDKVLKNVCGLACSDPAETPVVTADNAECEEEDLDGVKKGEGENGELTEGAVTRRGAEEVLLALSARLETGLFAALPKLWECMTEGLVLNNVDHKSADSKPADSKSADAPEKPLPNLVAPPQVLVATLQIIRSLAPSLHHSLHSSALMPLLPSIFACARHGHSAVRLIAGRCIATLAKAATKPVMVSVLGTLTPMLGDAENAQARRGAAGAIAALVSRLDPNILVPYSALLVVPLLGRMGDPDESVRKSVTHSFAALVPLLPLAKGMPPPRGLSEKVLTAAEDARFLDQLLDNRRTEDYKVPVHINGTLRRYQQEGVNWLAFLKRFKLHGVLCDDMGLGKTLQATTIIASAAAERARARALAPGPDNTPLPNLVVCPPTLVGHWAFEIEKFVGAEVLSPLQYQGTPAERARARALFPRHNVVVMSYDALRKDTDELERVSWGYCVLDEGHVIKNTKSKIAEAAKRVRAEHRLILSGTPIQNNVLELWSLFDFLMPGFLGTERQFNANYGRPLAAARNPKCTPKQAEAGVLALEALHKQVRG